LVPVFANSASLGAGYGVSLQLIILKETTEMSRTAKTSFLTLCMAILCLARPTQGTAGGMGSVGESWGRSLATWVGNDMSMSLRGGYTSWELDDPEGESLTGPELVWDTYRSDSVFAPGVSIALKVLGGDGVDDIQTQAGFFMALNLGRYVRLSGSLGASLDLVDADGDTKTGMGVYGRGGIKVRFSNRWFIYADYSATGVTYGDQTRGGNTYTRQNSENLEGSATHIGIGRIL